MIPRDKEQRAVKENQLENQCSIVYKVVKDYSIHLHKADVKKS